MKNTLLLLILFSTLSLLLNHCSTNADIKEEACICKNLIRAHYARNGNVRWAGNTVSQKEVTGMDLPDRWADLTEEQLSKILDKIEYCYEEIYPTMYNSYVKKEGMAVYDERDWQIRAVDSVVWSGRNCLVWYEKDD